MYVKETDNINKRCRYFKWEKDTFTYVYPVEKALNDTYKIDTLIERINRKHLRTSKYKVLTEDEFFLEMI